MKFRIIQTIIAILFCSMLSSAMLVAQTAYQPSGLIKKHITGVQFDLASVTMKDNNGSNLDAATFMQMVQSGKYSMETYVDEQEQVKEIVLRPKQDGEIFTIVTSTINQQISDNELKLKDELENIRMKDQMLRKILTDSCFTELYSRESEEYKYLTSLINREDKKNQERVIQIIDENGWLGLSQVGFMANNALFLVIQHASLEIQEKYFPLLKESVEKGESSPADMALMDDRIRMRRNMKQLYGSQTIYRNGKLYVWPIDDAANVDERRKSVQLSTLEVYLKLMGLNYPQDELPVDFF